MASTLRWCQCKIEASILDIVPLMKDNSFTGNFTIRLLVNKTNNGVCEEKITWWQKYLVSFLILVHHSILKIMLRRRADKNLHLHHCFYNPFLWIEPAFKHIFYTTKLYPVSDVSSWINHSFFHGIYYLFKIFPGGIAAAHEC